MPALSEKALSQKVLDEFADVATIRDKLAFSAKLARVIDREVNRALAHLPQAAANAVTVQSFRAESRWTPGSTELQQGRALMLKEFRLPHNLSVVEFAALAGKSRQQIYKDVEMRRLLALSVGARGQRIPDWQLDDTRRKLTQALLAQAPSVDEWTLYYALTEASAALSGKTPLAAVRAGNIERVLGALLAQLSIQR
jgi:hypothetical protein